jgi:hypothetical protein
VITAGDIHEDLTERPRLTAGAFHCVVETPRPPGDVYLFVIILSVFILSVLISRLLLLFVTLN